MKKTLSALFIAACSTSVFLAGCAEDPSENTPAATVADATPIEVVPADATIAEIAAPADAAPAAPMAEAKVYTISAESTIGFIGSKVTGSHEGGFKEFTGTVAVTDGDLSKAAIDFTITMASAFTDNEKLTTHLLSPDFFDGEQFPTATFVSTAIAADGDAYTVTGNFTLHGVTKSISFPATLALEGDTLTANAEFDINRMDFGVAYAGKADDLIRENVVIKLNIKASV